MAFPSILVITLFVQSLYFSTSQAATTLIPRDANCPCGYQDSTGAIWRENLVSNFVQDYNGALSNFRVQTWGPVSSKDTTYQKKYDADNIYQTSGGMAMRTKAYSASQGISGVVHSGEIDSVRDDILYGSFRVRAAIPTVPGVCFGFFTYKVDGNGRVHETDIEMLTADSDYKTRVHYTNQPGNVGGVTDNDAYKTLIVGGDLTTMSDHRFDWKQDSVTFWYQGVQTQVIRKNVPSVPSYLIANLWSDGGKGWTRGPPSADAVATVQFILGYFNSTKISESTFNAQCRAAGVGPCRID